MSAWNWSPALTGSADDGIGVGWSGISSYQAEYCDWVAGVCVGSQTTSCSVPVWMRVLSVWLHWASTQPPPIPIQDEEASCSNWRCALALGTVQSPVTEWKPALPRSIWPWL